MAKSGVNKENTKIRRSLNRHCLSLRSIGGLAKGERRFCKQKTNKLVVCCLESSSSISALVFKKTRGWLTW